MLETFDSPSASINASVVEDQGGLRVVRLDAASPVAAQSVTPTVVIPTRDRRDKLGRCLDALAQQDTERRFEVIVVDDGSTPPLEAGELPALKDLRIVRGAGAGPADARNRGAAAALGDVLLFTDDDTQPAAMWVEAACTALERYPALAGVEGRILSPPADPLHGHTIRNSRPGAFYTANIAYRRSVFERIGGFAPVFPYAHCEDLDLGFRVAAVGPIGFSPAMEVEHTPHRADFLTLVRRGRMAASERVLRERHPGLYPRMRGVPEPVHPAFHTARRWVRRFRADRRALLRSPRRLARFVATGVGETGHAVVSLLRHARRRSRASRR